MYIVETEKKEKFTTNYGIVHYIVKILKKIMALKLFNFNIFDITKNLLFPFMVSYSRVNVDPYGRLFDSEYNQIAFYT